VVGGRGSGGGGVGKEGGGRGKREGGREEERERGGGGERGKERKYLCTCVGASVRGLENARENVFVGESV